MSSLLYFVVYVLHLLPTYVEASPLCKLTRDELAPEVRDTSWPVLNVTAGSGESRYTINPHNNKGKASHTDAFKASLLNHPKALLYTGVNFTGTETRYDFGGAPVDSEKYTGSCYTKILFRSLWNSVRVARSCVRIFALYSCMGPSVAIYPGSTSNVSSAFGSIKYFVGAMSIGPCFSDEFRFASFSRAEAGLTATKDLLSPYQVPDVFGPFGYTSHAYNFEGLTPFSQIDFLVSEGPMNRTKEIRIVFDEHSLSIGVKPDQAPVKNKNLKWKLFDREEGDDLGFIIPPKLGGPAEEIYNVFPQSLDNKKKCTRITDQIFYSLASRSFRKLAEILVVILYYENETSRRPFGFYYCYEIFVPGRGRITEYDFLFNLN